MASLAVRGKGQLHGQPRGPRAHDALCPDLAVYLDGSHGGGQPALWSYEVCARVGEGEGDGPRPRKMVVVVVVAVVLLC